ncbi:MAG: hypothetical protein KAQ85_03515 [Thermodesulfovibrionia bacterium]|nr:hypothetical protein [Thermodesulfovibrionia bacterium]
MTKFISKNANLRIVLKHSMPAEPMTGRLAIPGLYIKFENGIVNVSNEEHVKMMLAHSGFDSDFIAVKEDQIDPYKGARRESEPDHLITEFEHGRAEKLKGSSHNVRLDPKLKDVAQKMAVELAKEIAPQLAKDMAKDMLLEMAKQKMAKRAQEENSRGATDPVESEPDQELNVPESDGTAVDSTSVSETDGPSESTPSEVLGFECVCGKIARTKAGLLAHQRTCDKAKNEIK